MDDPIRHLDGFERAPSLPSTDDANARPVECAECGTSVPFGETRTGETVDDRVCPVCVAEQELADRVREPEPFNLFDAVFRPLGVA